jgi:hypothetical protein
MNFNGGYEAIVTKYLPATNTKGARVKAECDAMSVTLPWDHSKTHGANHDAAVETLIEKMGWTGRWAVASLPGSFKHSLVYVRG